MSRINLFFDTEFTAFNDPHSELISIGIVDETGFCEFYAELEHDQGKASYFVEDVVYPLLQGIAKPASEVSRNLYAWLEKLRKNGEEIVFCCDYADDARFLGWLLGEEAPDWIRVADIANILFTSFSLFNVDRPGQHHALNDARRLRANYLNSISQIDDVL